ncbi:CPSF73-I, partial [Symbiodinium sp. CCMP2456]
MASLAISPAPLWNPARERLRFLPLLETELEEFHGQEVQLLADALRLLSSSATPAPVRRVVGDLVYQLRRRCGEHPLAALRWASCLLHVSRSALVATLALEVLDDAVAHTWMLTPQERQELKAQVEPMLSESAWRPRCGAVLRALGEQEHIARHSQSAPLPRCKSLPNVEIDPKPSPQSPMSATQKLRSPTRQEREYLPADARR